MNMHMKTLRLTGIALAGLFGAATTGASAAGNTELLVQSQADTPRSIAVEVADLDMASAYDRDTLKIRIRNAARKVCDVSPGSVLSTTDEATNCLDQAHQGAFAQLQSRGLMRTAAVSAGGMR